MNGTDTALAIGTCILACIGVCIILYKVGYTDGWDARGDHEYRREKARELRRTKSEAVIASKTSLGGADGCPSWYTTIGTRKVLAVPGIPLAALTRTVPLSQHRSTDTGELRALTSATDHFVARVEAEGAAYREAMSSRPGTYLHPDVLASVMDEVWNRSA